MVTAREMCYGQDKQSKEEEAAFATDGRRHLGLHKRSGQRKWNQGRCVVELKESDRQPVTGNRQNKMVFKRFIAADSLFRT